MKTSAILNPSGMTPNAAPKAAQAGAADADKPFGQVLSREVAERREADVPGKSSDARSEGSTAGTQAPEKKDAEDIATSDTAALAGEAAAAQLLALVTQLARTGQPAADTQDTQAAASADPHGARQGPAAAARIATVAEPTLSNTLSPDELPQLAAEAEPVMTKPGDFTLHADKFRQGPLVASTTTQPAAPSQAPETALGVAASAPAALHQAAGAAPAAADRLMPRVGTGAWDQALGQKMVWMVSGAQQSASLTLNPPDLGPLQVVLNVSNAQATANFIAAQPEVRQALEAAMPRLREMLGDAGIQLGQSSVSAGTPQQHGGFGDQRQGSGSTGRVDDAGAMPVRASQASATVRHGLVDTFA